METLVPMILSEICGMYDVECTCEELYFSTSEFNSVEVDGHLYPVCPICGKREGIALVNSQNKTVVEA